MKNKNLAALLSLLLAGSLVFSVSACGSDTADDTTDDATTSDTTTTDDTADDEEADDSVGFEEIPIGTDVELEGELNVAAVYFQPIDMEPAGMGLSAAESNLHLEADITGLEGNDLGYGAGDFVPGLTVDYEIASADDPDTVLQEGTFMQMVASDGPHYGGNIALDTDGEYILTFIIHSPEENGWMLHTDPETGVTGRWWTEPLEASFEWSYTVHEW